MRNLLDERYLNDPVFRNLVDTMLNLIHKQQTSFAEIREAALFAQLKYEMSMPTYPIAFSPQLLEEMEYRKGKK